MGGSGHGSGYRVLHPRAPCLLTVNGRHTPRSHPTPRHPVPHPSPPPSPNPHLSHLLLSRSSALGSIPFARVSTHTPVHPVPHFQPSLQTPPPLPLPPLCCQASATLSSSLYCIGFGLVWAGIYNPPPHLDGLAAVKQRLMAHGAVALDALLAALVAAEQRQAHAGVAVHAVEEVHAQTAAAPVGREGGRRGGGVGRGGLQS